MSRQTSNVGGCYTVLAVVIAVSIVVIIGIVGVAAYLYINPPSTEVERVHPAVPGPSIAVRLPAPGTQVPKGSSMLVFATATDSSRVKRIDLWIDDQLAVQQFSPDANGVTILNLTHSLIAVKSGRFGLTVRAYNALGAASDSPIVYITVFDPPSATPTPVKADYIIQAGDTLSIIAKKFEMTEQTILSMNPKLGGDIKPGMNIIVQMPAISLQGLQELKPPAGFQAIKRESGLIGALPQDPLPRLPVLPPSTSKVVFPLPGSLPGNMSLSDFLDPPNPPIKAPVILGTSVKGCQVTISWDDRSNNETQFYVYRRAVPVTVAREHVATLGENKTTYTDKVPRAGSYEYVVKASKMKSGDPLILEATSNPQIVEVTPTADCITSPDSYKWLVFKPISFKPDDRNITSAAIWFHITDLLLIPRRIPWMQGDRVNIGDWSRVEEQAVPLPEYYYRNRAEVCLDINGAGWIGAQETSTIPTDFVNIWNDCHPYQDLVGPRRVGWKVEGRGFILEYWLWIEDVAWSGLKYKTNMLPAPSNLRLVTDKAEIEKTGVCYHCFGDPKAWRVLAWDWLENDQSKKEGIKALGFVDGFIVYRSYSCPGEQTINEGPLIVPANQQGEAFLLQYEPNGCAYRYQVSAYGAAGESKPSSALEGKTDVPDTILQLSFEDLQIDKKLVDKPVYGWITLTANEYWRNSSRMIIEATKYNLKDVLFDDRSGNNKMTIGLTKDEPLYILFTVTGSQGEICSSKVGIDRPSGGWGQLFKQQTIKSSDGNCAMNVTMTLGK